MSFRSEEDMVRTAITSPALPLMMHCYRVRPYAYALEPKRLFGVPDIVLAAEPRRSTGRATLVSFAFELKLSNWQRALVQAFRYRSFADYSFVILDDGHAAAALANMARFRRANVGLLSMSRFGDLWLHWGPESCVPFSPGLARGLALIHWMPYPELTAGWRPEAWPACAALDPAGPR